LAGNPREWFNIMGEQKYRARWRMDHASDLTFPEYLRIARAESTTSNGISGIKLHYFLDCPPLIRSGGEIKRNCLPHRVAAAKPEISSPRKMPRHQLACRQPGTVF
jgi:hypothetical protein